MILFSSAVMHAIGRIPDPVLALICGAILGCLAAAFV